MAKKYFLFLVIVIFVNIFTVYFISREKWVYTWDYANYWVKFELVNHLVKSGRINDLWKLIHDSISEDYNYIPLIFSLPIQSFLSTSRLAYILLLANLYTLPAIASFIFFSNRILLRLKLPDLKLSLLTNLISVSLIVFSPFLWKPVFMGYIDAGALFFIFMILLVYFRRPFYKQSIKHITVISFSAFLVVFYRRYFAFWTFSFFASVFLIDVFLFSITNRKNMKNVVRSVSNLIFMALFWIFFMIVFADPILSRILLVNYSDIYSAYLYAANPVDYLKSIILYYGNYYSLLFTISIIYLITKQKTRYLGLFFLSQLVIIIYLFSRTQNINPQQHYLLLPSIITCIFIFLADTFSRIKNMVFRCSILAIYFVLVLMIFFSYFIPDLPPPLTQKIKFISPAQTYYPRVRNDTEEILRLVKYLNNTLKSSDYVYILSSSEMLNFGTVANACLSLPCDIFLSSKILVTHDVDKRDGFPKGIIYATYIVVADPVQIHLKPEGQRLITVLSEAMLSEKNIGRHFRKLPDTFTLDNNIKVYIYQKKSPIKEESLQELSDILKKYYPDKEYIYQAEGL